MDESGFLPAVIADPTNDQPRLVYADWLEEQDDPRAEFIRAQCELEHLRPNSERHWRLFHRTSELSLELQHEWTAAFPDAVRDFTFRRGFVEAVTVKADDFPDVADQIFALAPVIELRPSHLSTPKGNRAALLAACPAIANLRVLDLDGLKYTVNDLATLVASRHLKSLEQIRGAHLVGSAYLDVIGESTKLRKQLRSLKVVYGNNPPPFGGRWPKLETLDVDFARTVGDQKWVTPKLRRLNLRAATKSVRWQDVFEQFDLSRLDHLQLSGLSPLTKPGTAALTESGCLNSIQSFEMVCVTSRCAGLFSVKLLLKAEYVKLTGQDVSTKMTNTVVEHLAKGRLKGLELWYFSFDVAAAEVLATATGYSKIESLGLQARLPPETQRHAPPDPDHSAAISGLKDSTFRETLCSLNLPRLDFTHALELFSRQWPKLESLSIEGSCFADDQFERFLNYRTLPELRDLNVTNTGIGAAELQLIADGKYFPNLVYLDVRDNPVGGAAVRAIRNQYPDLTVIDE